jgi:hypothetical protein
MKLHRWLRIGVFLFAAAVLELSLYDGAKAEPYTAEEMVSECESVLSSAKATSDPDAIELDNTFSTGACWGAFLAIQQLVSVKMSGAKKMMFRVCLPEDTKLVQLIQVFDAYVKRHPERSGEAFSIVAIGSLYDSFHCR